jgi:hypothetical protein
MWVKREKNTTHLKCKVCEGWLNHWKKLARHNEDDEIMTEALRRGIRS